MAAAGFEVGDLVWAKMKNYPSWPARIENPPSNTKRKAHHYVFFFGTENFAWISDENIVHHSEEMLKSSLKKKSSYYKLAIYKIKAESEKIRFKNRPPVKEKGGSEMFAESLPSTSFEVNESKYDTDKAASPTSNRSSDREIEILSSSSSDPGIELEEEVFDEYTGGTIKYMKKKIGFLGLGKMGQMIVEKLIKSNHNVTVWNRTREKCEQFVQLGASYAGSPYSVVHGCDVTFCCVSGPKAVEEIFSGPRGVLAGFENTTGKGYVELTTIDSAISIKNAEAVRDKGGSYLESPVAESIKPGSSGKLVAVCAGDFGLFTKCESCFHAFTSDVCFLSAIVGDAANMHLLTNMFMHTTNAATAESLALIKTLNLKEDNHLKFLKDISFNCNMLHQREKGIDLKDFFTSDTFKNHQKDLRLALTLGDFFAQCTPLAAAANELYKQPLDLLHEPKNGESSAENK